MSERPALHTVNAGQPRLHRLGRHRYPNLGVGNAWSVDSPTSTPTSFLGVYDLDRQVTLTTNSQGNVTAQHSGPACVGALALFVDSVTKAGRSLDRVNGVLTSFVIPQ